MRVQYLEDGEDCFYIKFPTRHEKLLDAIKALIPYSDRKQDRQMGWDPEAKAWRFPLEYFNSVLQLVESLAPSWDIEEVEQLGEDE